MRFFHKSENEISKMRFSSGFKIEILKMRFFDFKFEIFEKCDSKIEIFEKCIRDPHQDGPLIGLLNWN